MTGSKLLRLHSNLSCAAQSISCRDRLLEALFPRPPPTNKNCLLVGVGAKAFIIFATITASKG